VRAATARVGVAFRAGCRVAHSAVAFVNPLFLVCTMREGWLGSFFLALFAHFYSFFFWPPRSMCRRRGR